MKRKIKFRAWTKKKEMQYNVVPFQWDYVIDRMWHKCIESNGNGILGSGGTKAKFEIGGYAIEEGDVMQFTGLKDKNGKEIYEGDIIDDMIVTYCGDDGFCLGMNCGWYLQRDDFEIFTGLECRNNDNGDNYEIIGNIYENPGLLKE
jgi:uncharacterized phage protein (TIGR01671 family)